MNVEILLKNDQTITAKGITKVMIRSELIEKFENFKLCDPFPTLGGYCPIRFIGSEEIVSIANIDSIISVKFSK